jgi:hypothetical protein
MEHLDVGRSVVAQGVGLGLPPGGDGLGQAELLDPGGLLPPIGDAVASPTEVVTYRALGDAEEAGRLALGLASLVQDLDRHDVLLRELGQGVASERPG